MSGGHDRCSFCSELLPARKLHCITVYCINIGASRGTRLVAAVHAIAKIVVDTDENEPGEGSKKYALKDPVGVRALSGQPFKKA